MLYILNVSSTNAVLGFASALVKRIGHALKFTEMNFAKKKKRLINLGNPPKNQRNIYHDYYKSDSKP